MGTPVQNVGVAASSGFSMNSGVTGMAANAGMAVNAGMATCGLPGNSSMGGLGLGAQVMGAQQAPCGQQNPPMSYMGMGMQQQIPMPAGMQQCFSLRCLNPE